MWGLCDEHVVNKDTTLKDFDGMLLCDRCIFTNADSIFGLKKKKKKSYMDYTSHLHKGLV